jgi:hypothetical protein
MIAFIQSFGLHGPAGGPKLLRALLQYDHPPVLSIDTGVVAAPSGQTGEEIHLSVRPCFGRLEWTRLHGKLALFDKVFRPRFENRLRRVLEEHQVKVIHTIPSAYDIVPISRVASDLGIPCFLNIHDDIEMTSSHHPQLGEMVAALGNAWRNAKGVFVISNEIGEEYCRRYGAREYRIVTDGLTSAAEGPQARPRGSLRVYFMGLFHIRYGTNLRALLDALKIIRSQHSDLEITVTCRCGSIVCPTDKDDVPVEVLPFAPDETVVEQDMLSADLLYQPLPFEAEAANFGRFSMSTKMVTYLGSGLPILYHGPENAAAYTLLTRHQAAIACTTLDAEAIAKQLMEDLSRREEIVNKALALARSQFMLADQQRRFWEPIVAAL